MNELDRLPSASLLVRINRAPMSRDGLKVLGIDDRPEKDWRKLGIWVEQPDYKSGKYNTSFIKISDSEKDLFKLR